MAFTAEVTRGAPTGKTSGSKPTVEFDRNVFIKTPATSNAKLNEKNVGRGLRERWRQRNEKESGPSPERISFKEDTRTEFTTFLDNWATNMHEALNKPNGSAILDVLPHAKRMAKILDVSMDQALDKNAIKQNINTALNTAEGWIATKALLDQNQALQAFAAGITHEGGQDGNTQTFPDALRQYVDDEGVIHKFGRQAGKHVLKQWQQYGTAGLAGIGFVALGPIGALGGVAFAAGAKVGMESFDRGRTTTQGASAEALQLMQSNEGLREYVKLTVGMDANDFVVQGGRIRNNPNIRPEDRGTRLNRRDFMDALLKNTVTRQKYYRDLHVPLSQQDAQPERFILSGSGNYERTGDRLHANTVDIWQNLRRAQAEERRRRGPENTPDDQTQRENLLRDGSGRGPESPLHGRNYPKGVEPPPFAPENVLKEYVDRWGQAEQDADSFAPDIISPATFQVDNALYPQATSPLERARSDWYGRAPSERVFFLGTEAVPFRSGTPGERLPYTLRRKGMPHPTDPDATIHAVDGGGRMLYEYGYNGERRVEISEATAEQQIFYITDNGERVAINDPRVTRTANLTRAEYTFNDGGGPQLIDANDMFYIPAAANEAPIPFSYLRSNTTTSYIPGDPTPFIFDPAAGPFPPIEVAEHKFFLVNPGAAPASMDNYPQDPNFIEDFYRDNWFIPPDETLTPLDPVRGEQDILYGRNFPQDRLAIMDRFVRNDLLQQEFTIDELQKFLQEGASGVPADRLPALNRALTFAAGGRGNRRPRTLRSFFGGTGNAEQQAWDRQRELRPLQPFDQANLKARDTSGRSPADVRFGISDPDILLALDALGPADILSHQNALETTGADQWGQLPGDPFFCRAERKNFDYVDAAGNPQVANLNEKIDLTMMVIDAWGQRKTYFDADGNDTGVKNLFFLIQNESDVAAAQEGSTNNLELWIRAREIALGTVTEDLIRKMRKIPTRNRSVIQAKRNARKEGGVNLKNRIEAAGKDKPMFEAARDILKDRYEKAGKYKKAKDELKKAKKDLADYIPKTLGASITTAVDAKKELTDTLSFSSTRTIPLDGEFEGKIFSIIPIAEQRKQALAKRQKAYADTRTSNPQGGKESNAKWDIRLQPEFDAAEAAYNEAKIAWEKDATILSTINTQINSFEQIIKDQTTALDPKTGTITKERAKAFRPEQSDRLDVGELLQRIPLAEWRTKTIPELLNLINAEHTADPNFGWPALENAENQQLLLYAVVYGRIANMDKTVRTAWKAANVKGASPTSVEDAINTAIEAVVGIDDMREDVLRILLKQATREVTRITNLEQAAKDDPTLNAESNLLDITDAAMGRQALIFGLTSGFMSRIGQTMPISGNDPVTVDTLSDAEKALLTEDSIGLKIPMDTPIAILELYDAIFGWRGRGDQKPFLKSIFDALPPAELVRVLRANAPETIPPLRGDETGTIDVNGFIVDLNLRIGDLQTGLQISKGSLRQMFVGVLDHLENSSLALYDPADVGVDPTEAAKIRQQNFDLAA